VLNLNASHPTFVGPNDILLVNIAIMKQFEDPMVDTAPLDALNVGMNVDNSVDMFLNLQNIEDIEMSTNLSKRKRY